MLPAMRRLLVPLLLVLVLLGGFGWWWYQPERVIARRIVALFDAAKVEDTTSEISRTTRGGAIQGFLAPNVTIRGGTEETQEYLDGPQSRDSIVANYTMAAKNCRRISFETPEVDEVTVTGDTAQAKARVDAIVEISNNQRPADGILNLDMEWKKIDGTWVLSSIAWKETAR